jgi:hypothetical protein
MLAMPRIESEGEMPPDASSKVPLCHVCHARLRMGDKKCWLCGASVTSDIGAVVATPPAVAPYLTKHGPVASFSMATLMMFVTLVAVVCGVFSIAPGIGVALALVLLPVLAHTAISAHREEALGHSLGPGERIVLFFGSLGLVVVAGVAASIAFGVTCFAGFFAGAAAGDVLGTKGYDSLGWGAVTGIGLGVIAGAFVGYRAIIALSQNSTSRRDGMPALSRGSKLVLAAAMLLAAIGAVVVFFLYGM